MFTMNQALKNKFIKFLIKQNCVICLLSVNFLGILCLLIFLHVHSKPRNLALNPNYYFDRQQINQDAIPVDQMIAFRIEMDSKKKERIRAVKKNIHLSPNEILELLGPVPKMSESDLVDRLEKDILNAFRRLNHVRYNETVVILTPIHNIGRHLYKYADLLKSLTYPRHLVSVALGEDGSSDDTLAVAQNVTSDMNSIGFRSVKLFKFNISSDMQVLDSAKHDFEVQYKRRRHIALARNLLLEKALINENWVLWIDSDLDYIPADLVEQLLYPNKDIVVPSCLFDDNGDLRVYDKNTWRETPVSLEDQKYMSKNQLIIEGYSDTKRIYLPDLRSEGRAVPLDGVGGCSLLIRAKCHKQGLIFPPKVYNHHVETEGLAKMAKDMGFEVYGLPFIEVFH